MFQAGALACGCPSEPVLGHEDVDVDDVAVRDHPAHDVVHLQFQDGMERSNYGPHLANYTHCHTIHVTLDDIK